MLEFLQIDVVLLIVAATWIYSLKCGFVSDDHAVIETRKDIIPEGEKHPKKENYWIKVFNDGVIMYYLNRLMWKISGKQSAFGWHLLNYSLHLLNTYLLYLVAAKILGSEIALCAALIWAVNPMQNQVAVWCSGRPYGIATTLALLMMIFWQKPFIVLPLYLLGIITSISVAFVPVILKVMHPNVWQGNLYLACLLLAIPWALWKFTRRFGKGALVLDRENYQFRIKRIFNLLRVYAYYLFVLVFPVKMGWYHEGGFRYNEKWDRFNVWACIGGAIVFWLIGKGAFGVWFLLGMLPNMNIFATNSYLQDRYVYFGSMGLALIAAPYLYQCPVLFIALVAVYAAKSYSYSRHMVNDERLYRENWRNHPMSDYAINNLGFFLIQQFRYEEARAIIKRGIDINRNNKLLWYNLGITWAATAHLGSEEGKFRFLRAMDCWKMALQIEPRWRKPKEDLDKLVKFMIDNKVLTMKKEEAAEHMPSVDMPAPGQEGS